MNSRELIYGNCYNNSEASVFQKLFYKESI